MSKIFRVKRNIDGFGGRMKDLFFDSFEKAKNSLKNSEALWFDEKNSTWHVEGMKELKCQEDENSIHLLGIQFPEEERDEWCIDYCECSISTIEVPFEIINKEIYLLKFIKGYNSWLYSFLDGITSTEKETIIEYCKSNKHARKIAARRKSIKCLPRLWVNPEEEERISPLGGGSDYLAISKVCIL